MQLPSLRNFGVFSLCAFLSCATSAKPAAQAYPRLSENLAASQNLEVRKVLHGDVEGLFALPGTRQLVAVAGGYLWKFSPQGELQDTLRVPSGIFTSGLVFTPHYYSDWVYSGNRQHRAYAPAVDGNRLSQAELFAELDRAEHVEFGSNDTSAWAYLLSGGKAWVLDITRWREKVDTYCRQRTHSDEKLGWNATCLNGYQPAPKGWTEIEPSDFYGTSQEDASRVKVVDFERRRLHLEEGLSGQLLGATVGVALKALGVPGNLPSRYWFGDASTQLRVKGEVLKFKAFIPKEDGQYRFPNMAWWDPSPMLPGASPWFTVHMRSYMHHAGEEALLRHYEKDIGLYVVRTRGSVPAPMAAREPTAWRAVFAGPATGSFAVSAQVEFAAQADGSAAPSVHTWLRSPAPRKRFEGMGPQIPVEALWPALQQTPSALTLQWSASFEQESTQLRIDLPRAETQAAFERLRGGKAPVELVVQVPALDGPASGMSVLLRSGSLQQALPGARIAYVNNPGRPRVARSTSAQPLQAANAAAQRSPDALPAFLQVAQDMAQDLQQAESLASDITHAYAQLINHFNGRKDFASSSRLVRHYLAQVYPFVNKYNRDNKQVYNVGVIASQTLAFAMATNERDLAEAVITTLIGPGFDPAAQTNGTLMYNLACYYALTSDKARLLVAVSNARRLGKPPSQFMQDTDFDRYKQDAEFLQVVNAAS